MVPVVPAPGSAAARIAAVVPVTLMVLFVGLLWLIGVACDERRRDYVTEISKLVMGKAHALLGLPPEVYVPVLPAMQGQMHDEIGQAVLTAKRPA